MASIGSFMKITTILLIGFACHAVCLENHEKCFTVEDTTICYFIPNVSSADWNTAWETCRELNATLPVIPSEKVQNMLSTYLRNHYHPLKEVWTAGRYTGNEKWRWNNGEAFTGKDKPSCAYNSQSCHHETQAVLTKHLNYEAKYPLYEFNYICSLSGFICTNNSEYFIPRKDGCLKWINNDRQSLNMARNNCLKDGGDLATFSEDRDLERLKKFSNRLTAVHEGYWVGLQQKWWIWNATDVQDIKYNMLETYGNLDKDCLIVNESLKWENDFCNSKKRVICQAALNTDKGSSPMPATDTTSSTIIGLVIAVLAVAIIAVVLFLFIKKRAHIAKAKTEMKTSDKKSDTVSPSQSAVDQSPDNIYATIDLEDDVENLNYENGPNPNTSHTKVEICSAVYSEPVDFSASDTDRPTAIYAEPYSNPVVTPVPKNLVPSSGIYAAPIKLGQQN